MKNYELKYVFDTLNMINFSRFFYWNSDPIKFIVAKLFATIILSWNSLKCCLWYLLKLSDPFIKNKNAVLPILIEKSVEQKIYFCLLKMRSIFFKNGNPIFSNKLEQRLLKSFSLLQKIQNFSFHTFWKETIGSRHQNKTADSSLSVKHP